MTPAADFVELEQASQLMTKDREFKRLQEVEQAAEATIVIEQRFSRESREEAKRLQLVIQGTCKYT